MDPLRTRPAKHNDSTTSYKISVEWSDRLAAYQYTFTEFIEHETGERQIFNTERGDADWAARIGAHYKIQIPVEPEEA